MNGNQNNQNNNQKKSEDTKRRNNTLIAISIVILVIILALVVGKKKTEAPATETPTTTEETGGTSEVEGSAPVSSSYQDALETYVGRSVQFDVVNGECSAFPTTQVFTVGSRVLLDNHGTQPVTVVFGAKTYNLKPFHYATLPLKETGTFGFECGGKNVATVTVR